MKKTASKILMFIIVLSVISGAFSGCGKKSDDDIAVPAGSSLARAAGCYFFYPTTVWIECEDGEYIQVVKANMNVPDNSSFVVNAWDEKAFFTAEQYWNGNGEAKEATMGEEKAEGYEKTLRELVQNYNPEKKEKITVGGWDAYRVVYTCTAAGVDFKIMQITVAVKKSNSTRIYELTYTSTPEYYDSNLDSINSMVESFTVE